MRVGVDGRAFSSVAGGVRRYVWELYRAMRQVDPSVEIVAIGAARDSPLPDGVLRRAAVPFPTNLGWMGLSLPLAAGSARIDVFHAPAYTAPLWGVHPQLLTIHDVSYERHPEWNAYRNDRFRRAFYRRGALASDRIVTDSAFSKSEIIAAYSIVAGQIDVVPLAPSTIFTRGTFDPDAAPPGVRQPYVLHVGDLHVRRNLTTVLAALLEIRRTPDPVIARLEARETTRLPDYPITRLPSFVCAGIDRGEGPRLKAQAATVADPEAIVLTGPVTDASLVNLYRGASLLAYPSRYEGFGLPVLEAMRCGTPVVGSNASSIPELMGGAGPLVPPLDVAAWTSEIRSILEDPAVAARWSDSGLTQAATFSWVRTARETLRILRGLAGQPV
jgi:alpha-1,3-rhamnosyl/mannosyltransferase